MGLSLPLTLAAHATLLVRGTSYVERLVGTRFGGRAPDRAEAARTLGAVALAGLVPGVVLLGIPPLVIGATGLLLIPALFGALRTTYDTERAALLQAALSEDLEHPGGLERQVHACLQTKSASDEEQMHALGLLAAIAPHDRLRSALLRYLEDATPPPGRIGNRKSLEAALALCAEHVVPPSTQACLQLARHEDPGVVRRAASFLADRPGARTQEILQHLLRSPSIDVQLVAARALGFMGTHAAVGELGSLVSRTVNPRVRRTARTAIAAIRGRVGGAEAAALSFPAEVSRGGELSPAPGEAGELSVPEAREVAAARVAEGSAAAADEQQPDEQQAGPGPADGSTVRAGASAALVAGP